MNDLAQINQRNARAIADNIPQLLAKGHYVVVEKAGLSVVGCETFSGDGAAERAQAKLDELNARGDSTHGELHEPPTTASLAGAINDDHLAQRLGLAA